MSGEAQRESFFVPEDWLVSHRPGSVSAVRLSTGENLTIDGKLADSFLSRDLDSSAWKAISVHEPLVGTLLRSVASHGFTALNRASLLKGAGWRQLFIELTARCNERCVHCYAESSPERDESLGWEEIRRALDDAKALGFETVQLTGGDPLLSPHCVAAAAHARALGIQKIEVYTNGLALRGELYRRLRELGVSFAFSYYSHDEARHDAVTRTPGSHARTTRAMRRAVEDGLSVRTGTVLVDENERDADETRTKLVELGLQRSAVRVVHSRSVGRGGRHEPPSERAPAMAEVESRPSPVASPFGGTAALSYEGTVYPCIFSRHLPLGSVRETSLREILSVPEPLPPPPDELIEKRSAWAGRLSCWQCQTRSLMLGADSNG